MSQAFMPNEWYRRDFSKVPRMMQTPPLMRLQINSYEDFLQWDVSPAKRQDIGLQAVFKSVFPIYDFNKTVSLEFVSYSLESPKYTVKECRQRSLSYESPLKVLVRLVFYDVTVDKEGNEQRSISSVKEQEVYLGNIPLMAETGSFVYNGTERVIVSQLHRSPGIVFEHDSGKKHSSGNFLYSARIIPHRVLGWTSSLITRIFCLRELIAKENFMGRFFSRLWGSTPPNCSRHSIIWKPSPFRKKAISGELWTWAFSTEPGRLGIS